MPSPLAYSYIRFSSEKQSQGDSLKRQLKLATDYAAEHKLTLDSSSYRDLGVSAFKGKNALGGKLGAFIEAVDNGAIKPGSYLLVESLDRLSRNDVHIALELFLSIIRKGITIVTLADKGAVYSKETLKTDNMALIMSILVMIRANEESANKSRLIKAAWASKAADGDIMTKVCPGWIKLVDGKFELIEDRAKVVQRMFELYGKEGRGSPHIAKLLNNEGIKPFGWASEWTNGTVASILSNPATYGTLRRKKADKPSIPNYYPAAITEDAFVKGRAAAQSREWKGGRKGKNIPNLFSGMSFCGYCGSTMRIVSTHNKSSYLKCTRAHNSKNCISKTVSMPRAEKAILSSLVVEQKGEIWTKMHTETVDRSAPLRVKLLENEGKTKSLIKLAEQTGDIDTIAKRINELNLEKASLKKQIAAIPGQMIFDDEELKKARGIFMLMSMGEIDEKRLTSLRMRLQSAVRHIFQCVVFWSNEEEILVAFTDGVVLRAKIDEEERYRVNGTFARRPS